MFLHVEAFFGQKTNPNGNKLISVSFSAKTEFRRMLSLSTPLYILV